MVATAQNTRADAWPIYDDQALYLDTAIRNAVAGAPVGAAFSVLLSLDGNVLATLAVSPATMAAAPGGVLTWCDISAGPLSAGDHTLRIDVDAGNAVAETSESDNSFSRTISVLARPHAGLGVAYQQNALANNAVAPVDAGSVLRGETAPTLTFTITNTGNATLAVGNPSIPAGFALSGNITFATNVPGISTFTIPVSGTVSNPPPPPLPNLALQTPAGFSSPLLVATSAAATADAARIVDNQAVYTRFGLANLVAGSSLTGAVNVAITLDGRQIALLTLQPAELGSPYTSAGIALGTLPAGAHTLRMQIDPQNTIAESDETDNVIERTFTVVARDIAPPTAIFKATSITRTSTAPFRFSVTYIDNQLVDRATIGKGDLLVTGPKKYRCIAALVSITPGVSASQVTATYSITAPGKAWDKTAAGVYTITLQARQVADTSGNFAATKRLGTFSVFAKAPVVAKASVSKAAAPPASATAALFASRPIMAPWWLDVP
ncbi:MAG: CARDB domain-containing protein [Tepidisphaeraceae bacterium]